MSGLFQFNTPCVTISALLCEEIEMKTWKPITSGILNIITGEFKCNSLEYYNCG